MHRNENSDENTSELEKQVRESREKLQQLLLDSTDYLSNVKVALKHRKVTTGTKEENHLEKVEHAPVEDSQKQEVNYADISQKWLDVSQKTQVDELENCLLEQISLCNQMLDQQNTSIIHLQQEIQKNDESFLSEIEKQKGDLHLLIKRMIEQITSVAESFRLELTRLKKQTKFELGKILKENESIWNDYLTNLQHDEVQQLTIRRDHLNAGYESLVQIYNDGAEELRQIKCKLDSDVQQLEDIKAIYLLNTEKLDYNCQILRKREDENIITKTYQKRQITKMLDMLSQLQQNVKVQEQEIQSIKINVNSQINSLNTGLKEVWQKLEQSQKADLKLFDDMIKCVQEECQNTLVQILGVISPSLENKFLKNLTAHYKKPTESDRAVVMPSEPSTQKLDQPSEARISSDLHKKMSFVKQSVFKIVYESGFLIDDNLEMLLSTLDRDWENILKLDSVLETLGFGPTLSIKQLCSYLLKSVNNYAAPDEEDLENLDSRELRENISSDIEKNKSLSAFSHCEYQLQNTLNAMFSAFQSFLEHQEFPESSQEDNQSRHQSLALDPEEQKMKDFVDNLCVTEELIIPSWLCTLWTVLDAVLKKYFDQLQIRQTLINDVLHLQKQNSDIQNLLREYAQEADQK